MPCQSHNHTVEGLQERNLIRATLGRFVPEEVATSLLSAGGVLEAVEAEATVLFSDLEGFTPLTEQLGPAGIVDLLNERDHLFGQPLRRFELAIEMPAPLTNRPASATTYREQLLQDFVA